MCSSNAASISHVEGVEVGVNSEKLRWYVRAYLRVRVVHFDKDSAASGASALGDRSGGADDVDSRYAIIACSSANISRSVAAM